MPTITSEESYIVDRYRLWRKWSGSYAYKHAKGARIAAIIHDTGGYVETALEIGVGPGGIATAVSRRGIKILGIDLSPDALELAREHCRTENVTLIRASGFSLPIADGSLRLAYASQVLHLFDPLGRLAILKEVHRILAPGGRFIFDMKNLWSHPARYLRSTPARRQRNFPSHLEIRSLLGEAGFSKVTTFPGLLPLIRWSRVPNLAGLGLLAHTTFFVAQASEMPT